MVKDHLVFITGFLCDREVFREQERALSEKVNVHIVESINFDSLEQYLEHINHITDEPIILSGHSLGAWVAIEYLNRHPERVKKLIILSSNADEDDENYEQVRLDRIKQARDGCVDTFLKKLAESFIYQPAPFTKLLAMLQRNKACMEKQQVMLLYRKSRLPFLSSIKKPTLVLVGEKDNFFFDSSLNIAKTMQGATLEIIKESGHMITMESPTEVSDLILGWL
jgi:pimeloyl-ACP methyl ester carboxylesterase